jgi:hypothetical protein
MDTRVEIIEGTSTIGINIDPSRWTRKVWVGQPRRMSAKAWESSMKKELGFWNAPSRREG